MSAKRFALYENDEINRGSFIVEGTDALPLFRIWLENLPELPRTKLFAFYLSLDSSSPDKVEIQSYPFYSLGLS